MNTSMLRTGCELSETEIEEIRRRNNILYENFITTKHVDECLSKCKDSRDKLEKSLEDTKSVLDKWETITNEFQDAVDRLGDRIEEAELEVPEEVKPEKERRVPRARHSCQVVSSNVQFTNLRF